MAKKRVRGPVSNNSDDTASLFAAMMEYLKVVQKEARQDRRTARSAEKCAHKLRTAKLALETAQLDQMMEEAKQMADCVRLAALTAILNGEVSSGMAFTVTLPRSVRFEQKAVQLQRQIDETERAAQEAAKRAKDACSAAEESRDRKKRCADSILKLLDVMSQMKFDI